MMNCGLYNIYYRSYIYYYHQNIIHILYYYYQYNYVQSILILFRVSLKPKDYSVVVSEAINKCINFDISQLSTENIDIFNKNKQQCYSNGLNFLSLFFEKFITNPNLYTISVINGKTNVTTTVLLYLFR